jgi:hypothetical protein
MSKRDRTIAEELITYNFSGKETLKDLSDIFYAIMKKHKVSRTHPAYNDEGKKTGEIGNNFEWTLYHVLWLDSINRWLDWHELLK